MGTVTNLLLCSLVAFVARAELSLKEDRPFLRVPLEAEADLECCYGRTNESVTVSWYKHNNVRSNISTMSPVELSDSVTNRTNKFGNTHCGTLTFRSVQLEDSALYFCTLETTSDFLLSHGTYLQVYRKLKKTINVSENTKNKILRAEGILLFLSVVLPAVTLLFQSKKLHQLERKKVKREEENIYQGLDLDLCAQTTYDQIQRSQAPDPYQDVYNMIQGDEEIQLEKP